jgi:hypothetical protein
MAFDEGSSETLVTEKSSRNILRFVWILLWVSSCFLPSLLCMSTVVSHKAMNPQPSASLFLSHLFEGLGLPIPSLAKRSLGRTSFDRSSNRDPPPRGC